MTAFSCLIALCVAVSAVSVAVHSGQMVSGYAKCQTYTPTRGRYQMTPFSAATGVVFDVKTSGDAHIGFFTATNSTNAMYEIIIGGRSGQNSNYVGGLGKSVIRRCTSSGCSDRAVSLIFNDDADLESPLLWASATTTGEVRLGCGTDVGQHAWLQFQDSPSLPILYVGVKSGATWNVCQHVPSSPSLFKKRYERFCKPGSTWG